MAAAASHAVRDIGIYNKTPELADWQETLPFFCRETFVIIGS